MRVRCGRCQTAFDVAGTGRFTCPACGTANEVKGDPGGAMPAGAPSQGGLLTPPPAPDPDPPSPRIRCDDCGILFIVGGVTEAPCPNCGASVTVSEPEGVE